MTNRPIYSFYEVQSNTRLICNFIASTSNYTKGSGSSVDSHLRAWFIKRTPSTMYGIVNGLYVKAPT